MNRLLYAILAGLMGAVIVHIAVLFMVPYYAHYNAWNRLEAQSPKYAFFDLSSSDPIRQSSDPLFALKACLFNLTDGPVHIQAEPMGMFWSMSIYDREGINIYSLNDRTTPNGILDLVIGDPVQIMELKQASNEAIANSVLISENLTDGFMILRNFDSSQATIQEKQDFLHYGTCKTLDY